MLLVAKYKEQISVQYKPIDHRLLFYSAGDASVRDMGGQMLIAPSRVCLHARGVVWNGTKQMTIQGRKEASFPNSFSTRHPLPPPSLAKRGSTLSLGTRNLSYDNAAG